MSIINHTAGWQGLVLELWNLEALLRVFARLVFFCIKFKRCLLEPMSLTFNILLKITFTTIDQSKSELS